jgi:glycosyltransferase involved in cell wall biosynthesis
MGIPKVSVILTFYNRPDMVKRAINHIILQSFQDFELILVDDFSDKPLALDDIEFGDLVVTNIRNKANIGANQSRLNGLKIAKGEYVCFHDDDDYWMVDKLEKQFNFLEENSDYHLVTAYAKTNKKVVKFPKKPSSFSLSIHNCIGSFSIPMIRNSDVLYTSLDNNLSNAQDWNVWRGISKHHKVGSLEDILVFFDDGVHDRISSVKNIEQYYSSYLKVALRDSPNTLIKYYHQSLANYHCSDALIKTYMWGFSTMILRGYIKIRLWVEES